MILGEEKKTCWPKNILRFLSLVWLTYPSEMLVPGKDGSPQQASLAEVLLTQLFWWKYLNIWNLISPLAFSSIPGSILLLEVWNDIIAFVVGSLHSGKCCFGSSGPSYSFSPKTFDMARNLLVDGVGTVTPLLDTLSCQSPMRPWGGTHFGNW